jgi:serpin B
MKSMLMSLLGLCLVVAIGCKVSVSTKKQGDPTNPQRLVVAKDNNSFAIDLYRNLREKEGNLFFSPTSISTALAMTYGGAREKTAEEMAKTLHFSLTGKDLHPACASLIAELNGAGTSPDKRGYQLNVANALWGMKGYGFNQEFVDLCKDHYEAGLQEVDFADSEKARKTINDWIEEKTQKKIQDMIKSGVLSGDTRLVLTNAIYFKGDWALQFDKQRTKDDDFHVGGKTVKVPMMHNKLDAKIFEDASLQALNLPYKGKELSMIVILPKKKDGLADLEKTLSLEKITEWVDKAHQQDDVNVWLPKFKMTTDIPLAAELQKLGMKAAFNSGGADFSGIPEKAAKSIFLGAVLHKAFVEVNEEGTEAAASTVVELKKSSEPIVTNFRADHPFLFLIRDNRNSSILFMGRVTNPLQN